MPLLPILIMLCVASSQCRAAPSAASAMASCTAVQRAALASVLARSTLVPRHARADIEPDCRQLDKATLAFTFFVPLLPWPAGDDVSAEEVGERDVRLVAGLFDVRRRRVVASHARLLAASGWIKTFGHSASVYPVAYASGKNAVFAISHGTERSSNAADFHVNNELTVFMRRGAALLPVLESFPLDSVIALTEGGGICCAHVVLQVRRQLVPTGRQRRGIPDLEMRAERELVIDESVGPAPRSLAKGAPTYSYTMFFNGKTYAAGDSKGADPWDGLDQ